MTFASGLGIILIELRILDTFAWGGDFGTILLEVDFFGPDWVWGKHRAGIEKLQRLLHVGSVAM